MNILGLGGSIHDYSACLTSGSEIVHYIEEERLLKIKHALNIGRKTVMNKAAEYCLMESNLKESDLDMIVTTDIVEPAYYSRFSHHDMQIINHHLSHAASSFYPSPFRDAAILVVDGRGSSIEEDTKETISFYYGEGNQIQELKKSKGKEHQELITNSLGCFYEEVTKAIGFEFLQDGKTMGLAPYGTDKYVNKFHDFFGRDEQGMFLQTASQLQSLRDFIIEEIGTSLDPDQCKADFAFAVQHHTEEYLIHACQFLYQLTKSKNLCLSGGVALNSVANNKIAQHTPFENIYIFPAAGDAGTAVGCALYGYYALHDNPRIVTESGMCTPYLGKEYSKESIKKAIDQHAEELIIHHPPNLTEYVSDLLADGKIVGWFQGRSEAGPRSLGNRSILADPRRKDMKDTINKRIKHREPFRPFAPAILEEHAHSYFSLQSPSPYMLFVSKISPSKRNQIPAVTHVDGTGRVQTVSKTMNPLLHSLLECFYNKTGVPVLLNTSFNDNGQPIIESPMDAVVTFLKLDLDYLVVGEYVLAKSDGIKEV
ncbi:carbamoyltransferase [Fictibacillus solisalsi]|uniref:Carbamoyltransferase n=1 Tax=Fictibacillus solisalsi TaxID=459525 RepID=A0A1H0BRU6_9BACL|nr:carbamoyltransferase C-terminal domain-containing protein [Fictibacillus solisalsi]SDN48317.1 carbamoyltransferase [Fictibacillus solisalsi]